MSASLIALASLAMLSAGASKPAPILRWRGAPSKDGLPGQAR